MDKIIEHNVNDIVDTILNDYTHDRSIDKMPTVHPADRFVIIKIIDNLMKIMYPAIAGHLPQDLHYGEQYPCTDRGYAVSSE